MNTTPPTLGLLNGRSRTWVRRGLLLTTIAAEGGGALYGPTHRRRRREAASHRARRVPDLPALRSRNRPDDLWDLGHDDHDPASSGPSIVRATAPSRTSLKTLKRVVKHKSS